MACRFLLVQSVDLPGRAPRCGTPSPSLREGRASVKASTVHEGMARNVTSAGRSLREARAERTCGPESWRRAGEHAQPADGHEEFVARAPRELPRLRVIDGQS